MKRFTAITAAVLMLAACGKDDNNANNGTNNGTNNANNMSNETNNDNNMSNATNNENNVSNTTNNDNNVNNTNNSTIVPCGDVTFEGECSDATTALYCDEDFGLVEIPCVENFGANATCILIDDYGADCAVPAGDSCEVYDEDLDEFYYLFCSGNEPACVWNAAEAVVCVDDFGTCDPDAFVESCNGDNYIYDCSFGQPQAADCAALGGTCDAAQGCVMPMDATCDDVILLCDAGLTCTIPADEVLGTCTM